MQNGPNLDTKNSNFNSFENGQQLSNEFSSHDVVSNQRQDPPANQDFPIFENNSPPQNTKNISFRKKFDQNPQPQYQQEGLPEIYARSEFFNFYGVLNFKVRKYNRRLMRQAFEDIFERSVDFESRIKVFACGQLIKKDRFFMDLDRLKNEVNRRNFIRKNTIFKLYHALNMKRSEVFHAFRFNRDHPLHPEDIDYDDRYERGMSQIFIIFEFELQPNLNLEWTYLICSSARIDLFWVLDLEWLFRSDFFFKFIRLNLLKLFIDWSYTFDLWSYILKLKSFILNWKARNGVRFRNFVIDR